MADVSECRDNRRDKRFNRIILLAQALELPLDLAQASSLVEAIQRATLQMEFRLKHSFKVTLQGSHSMTFIETPEELQALFGAPSATALRKEADHLHPVYQRWIQASGFAVLATSGPDGLDTSPRGDPVPLVKIIDEKTLVLPERKGNNRIDGLRNILHDPRVSLIFLVPGVDETLRVNGRARITADTRLMTTLAHKGQPPVCALWIHVEQVFFQCGKSMMRSGLWQPRAADAPPPPSAGEMMAAFSSGTIDAAQYDQEKPQRLRDTMY